jgi:hypothetical protein
VTELATDNATTASIRRRNAADRIRRGHDAAHTSGSLICRYTIGLPVPINASAEAGNVEDP